MSKRGVDRAVLVPVEEWERMQRSARPTMKDLLLADRPRAEIALCLRGRQRRRRPPELG